MSPLPAESAGASTAGAGAAGSGGTMAGAGGDGAAPSLSAGSGAGGSGDVDGPTQMLCDQGCHLTDGLCPNELDVPACDADCEQSMANLVSLGCSQQSRDYLSCVVTQPLSAFHCDGLGQSELRLGFCDEVRDDLSDCAILASLNQ